MRNSPEQDRGNDRDRPSHRPTTGEPNAWRAWFRTWSFSPERQTAYGESCGLVVCKCRLEAFSGLRSADLTSKAAETLRSPSGGVPAARGEAAVTRDRRDRERQAGRGGAVSMRWAVDAVACGAMGCRESEGLVRVEADGDRRVLCLRHARRWVA